MALEDFTTYEEVDPNNHIERTAHHIDFHSIRNESAWVVKDFGDKYFDNFEHKIQARKVSGAFASVGFFWVLSNAVNDVQGLVDAGETFIGVQFVSPTEGINRVRLFECVAGGLPFNSVDDADRDPNIMLYFTIKKQGTSLTCEIYSDSARTNLLNTLSLELQGDYKFRYLFPAVSQNTEAEYASDVDIENLDVPPPPPEEKPAIPPTIAGIPTWFLAVFVIVLLVLGVGMYYATRRR